jgi:hypothetical protein
MLNSFSFHLLQFQEISIYVTSGHDVRDKIAATKGVVVKHYRWSIIFSVSNLLLAMFLFSLGQREFKSLTRSPGAFYEGSGGYIPTAEEISYCLNMPSLAATAPLRNWLMGHIVVRGCWVTYGDVEYGIAVFVFWWWVGSKLDRLQVARVSPHPGFRFGKLVGRIFGFVLSLVLLYGGVTGLLGKSIAGKPVLISMILWGVGLLYYFAGHLYKGAGASSERETNTV